MIAKTLYRWAIDRVNNRFISGWCFNRLARTRPVTITFMADGTRLGAAVNSGYRSDLKELCLHPSGVCAFDFSFPAGFDPRTYENLYLLFDGFSSPAATISCRDVTVREPDPVRPICFMHIPKTAGTSFNAFARACFAAGDFFTHVERLPPPRREEAAGRAKYLAGHLPVGELAKLTGPTGWDYYTIIREPLHHLHSHLNYVRGVLEESGAEPYLHYRHHDAIKEMSARLNDLDFRDHGELARFVDGLDGCERDFFDNIQTRYFLRHRPVAVDEADFAAALEQVEGFRSVGLTEQYDRFRDRFCGDIGLPTEPQPIRGNTAGRYQLFDCGDAKARELLYPLIRFDLRLYDHVRQKFWPG